MAVSFGWPPPAAPSVAEVQRWRAEHHRSTGARQRVEQVYIAVVAAAIAGTLVYGTARSALAAVLSAGGLGQWGPSLVLVGLLGAARSGIVQGPVVFTLPDVTHLLGAPLPRAGLVTRPLRRALWLGVVGGAVVGGVLLVGLTDSPAPPRGAGLAALVVGCALAGLLAVLASWGVSVSGPVERVVRVGTWPAVAVAAALAVAGVAGHAGVLVARWSGPWGWALAAGTGAGRAAWVACLALEVVVVLGAVVIAARHRDAGSVERFLRRAEGRSRLTASLMSFDARTARQGLASVSWESAGGRPARQLRVVRARAARARRWGPVAAIVWRDLVAGAESPGAVLGVAPCAAGGTVLALLDAHRVVATIAGAVLVYVAAARAIEPLRMELDLPRRSSVLLGMTNGRAAAAHAIVPLAAFAVAGALATAGVAIAGALPPAGGAAAAIALLAAPAICGFAILSARRGGRLPRELLLSASMSDPSGGGLLLIAWLVAWPAAAAATLALPLGVLEHGPHHRAGGPVALAAAALVIALTLVARIARQSAD
jgi:hypothetical protein